MVTNEQIEQSENMYTDTLICSAPEWLIQLWCGTFTDEQNGCSHKAINTCMGTLQFCRRSHIYPPPPPPTTLGEGFIYFIMCSVDPYKVDIELVKVNVTYSYKWEIRL